MTLQVGVASVDPFVDPQMTLQRDKYEVDLELHGILNSVQVHSTFIRQVVEDITSSFCLLPSLLEPVMHANSLSQDRHV